MGLLEELGAFLDTTKRRTTHFVQNPGLLWSQLNEDARAYQDRDRQLMGEERSVMPEVRQAAAKESNARAMELGGLLGAGAYGNEQ
ncbi:MAG: hypothetical protein MUC51_19685 [Anaerolineae bacterium]|nr:hypothetical protein [Anaerolineae bacterium]